MGTYIIRRLLQMIPVILGATFLIFAMVFALPGDPLAGKCGERPCSPQYAAAFREKYNLNDPLPVQYGKYLGNLAKGDLGETFQGVKVSDQLKLRYPITAKLAVMAILFESILGILAGVLTGIKKGGFLDNLVLVSTLVVISIPVFVIGGLAQYVFGVKLGLFPVTVTSVNPTFYELALPAMVLGSLSLAYVTRLTRTNLSENLRADYVRTAVAKGLTRRRAIGLHALRNSMIPVITFIGFDFGALLGGAIVTERVFAWPGIGQRIVEAILARDYPVVQAVVLVTALMFMLINLLVDLFYMVLDPRLRT